MDTAQSEENSMKRAIRNLLTALEAAGRSQLPGSNDALLRSIVEAAARIFQAAAASILLVNEQESILEFKVSTGAANQSLVGMRIPLDQGIAGYVAMTGQPIAISDVQEDARFNREFARSTGYVPRSILATPLTSGERVLGVMEVLDKIDAPSFGIQDMELLGLFAGQAALAIEISQKMERLGEALVNGLKTLATTGEEDHDDVLAFLEESAKSGEGRDLLQVAGLLNEFSRLGDEERKAGLKILEAFAEYGRAKRQALRGARPR
jgi:GAF domain-containing protein